MEQRIIEEPASPEEEPHLKRPRLSTQLETCNSFMGLKSPMSITSTCVEGLLEDFYEFTEPDFRKTGNSAVVRKVRRKSDGRVFAGINPHN